MHYNSKPKTADPLCRIAAVLSVSAFAVLLIDALVPAAITAPRIAGAPVVHLLPE
jgi:hypothetical protein